MFRKARKTSWDLIKHTYNHKKASGKVKGKQGKSFILIGEKNGISFLRRNM